MKIWDSATGKELFALKGHAGWVNSVAFSPDGQRLASGSNDRTVKLWDSATGKELFALKGHAGPVHSVAFSPDGQRLASGSWDQTVRIWDSVTGKELLRLQGPCRLRGERGVQPGRPAPGVGELGPDREDLGQRDRQGAVRLQGPCRSGF